LIGEAKTIPAFELRDNGGYPLLSSGGEQAVWGEVYEIDDTTLALIDQHEDHPRWHRRTQIELNDGTYADAYLMPIKWAAHRDTIVSGSWRAEREADARSITVEFTVAEMDVRAALETAIGRRIPRWADIGVFRARPEAPNPSPIPSDVPFLLDLVERATGKTFSLRDQWPVALGLMARHDKGLFANILLGVDLGIAGDALVQLAAFGEVKYPLFAHGSA
jgi:gamma-glutamylcyclotransferase (GGCT)/AIG2-like uncharacterized protein YtfP